jgi:hypothetical protein
MARWIQWHQSWLPKENTHQTLEHIQLSQLPFLRNLKITSSAFDFEERFDRNKRAVCQLLSSSPLSPTGIRSLSIGLNVQMFLQIDSTPTPYTVTAWSELDDILMEASFASLQHVDLDFQFFFYTSPSYSHKSWQSRVDFEDGPILPRLSNHPSIQFQFKSNTICIPKAMGMHLYSPWFILQFTSIDVSSYSRQRRAFIFLI